MRKFILAILILTVSFIVDAKNYSTDQTKLCSYDENLTCDLNNEPLNGILISSNSSEVKVESNFKDGRKEGIQKGYTKDGILLFEMNFKDGKRDGFSKGYDINGNLIYEETFKNGKSDGFLKNYDRTAQLRIEENIKDNKRISHKRYSEDGKLHYEMRFDPKSKNSTEKSYYKNGNIKSECFFKKERLEGICKIYDENGRLSKEDIYKERKLVSSYIYNEEGKKIERMSGK